jgi:hypothetical protein
MFVGVSALAATLVATTLATTTSLPAQAGAPVPVGTIQTVLGTLGDGGPAGKALLDPSLLTADAAGNVYVSDRNRVRRIDIATGIIDTVAGTGASGATGDGGPATDASLGAAQVAVAPNGDLYIGDSDNKRIRKVDAATGIISTIAGNGVAAFAGDNGPATSASVRSATGVALDSQGTAFARWSSQRGSSPPSPAMAPAGMTATTSRRSMPSWPSPTR